MSDQTSRKCPQCGTELPSGSAGGVCPRCAAGLLQATQTDIPGESTGAFTPPTVAELAAKFPQLEILELIGRGGMGAVYKARQRVLDRIVALKILPPDIGKDAAFAERFAREAKALAKLNHPGIVTIYDFGRADGLYFFLMEFVDGMNLRELLHNGRISAREALAIVPQICDALQFAHDQGIVHRDIKPENLLMDRRGRVKVADFGLAKLVGVEPESTMSAGSTGESSALTEAGKVMGTPNYMSPEQVERPGEVDHRADIYALGVVFYQMLTGELPDKQLQPPSRKVQIDVRLDEVVLRALERKPERRYQQASVLKTQIETIANGPASSGPAGTPNWYRGFEYKSKATLFGLPWLHVTSGMNPDTGRVRISRGIIAIGGVAQGVVAFGGVAMGGFALGGLSLGIFSFGGLAIGMIVLGGLALGLLGAVGGGALAPIALGGLAIGYFAKGGLALGAHTIDALRKDPVAVHFFGHWAGMLMNNFQLINCLLVVLSLCMGIGLPMWLKGRAMWGANGGKNMGSKPPFFSSVAWEIYGHMTGGEKLAYQTTAMCYGIWNAMTFFLPFACIEFFPIPVPLNWIIATAVLLAGLSLYPLWWKWQAKRLSNTEWARAKGIPPESIRMFAYGTTGLMLLGVIWLALVGAIWWQGYQPEGVWLPYLSQASVKPPEAGGAMEVLDVRQYGQIVWLSVHDEPLPRSAILSPTYAGPMIELPYRLPAEATNVDCLVTTAPHSYGKIIAGTNDLSSKTDFLIAFVLPDEQAAAAAVKQIKKFNLGQSHALDSPLFVLRRTLGKDSSGKPMAEEIFGSLQLQGRHAIKNELPVATLPPFQVLPVTSTLKINLSSDGSNETLTVDRTEIAPAKTIMLTRATNQIIGTNINLRSVDVWSETTIFPGEKIRALVAWPDGQLRDSRAMLFTTCANNQIGTSSSYTWAFADSFGQSEADAAVAQMCASKTERALTLTSGVPLEMFCVTNRQRGTLTGYIEFDLEEPQPTNTPGGIKATVHVRDSSEYYSWNSISFSADVPAGYALRASANEGQAEFVSPDGPNQYRSTWFQPSSGHRSDDHAPVIWAVKTKLPGNARPPAGGWGSFEVVPGKPKLIFSITNGPDDVYQAYLELDGPGTNRVH